jgi:hypothetical protein
VFGSMLSNASIGLLSTCTYNEWVAITATKNAISTAIDVCLIMSSPDRERKVSTHKLSRLPAVSVGLHRVFAMSVGILCDLIRQHNLLRLEMPLIERDCRGFGSTGQQSLPVHLLWALTSTRRACRRLAVAN